jgi:hypothetical protein
MDAKETIIEWVGHQVTFSFGWKRGLPHHGSGVLFVAMAGGWLHYPCPSRQPAACLSPVERFALRAKGE